PPFRRRPQRNLQASQSVVQPDPMKCPVSLPGKEISPMSIQRGPRIGLALVGLVLLLSRSPSAFAQVLSVRTDRGCGSQAVYQLGETSVFFFSSSQTVNARLTLAKPDGTILILADQQLIGGVTYTFTGQIALPNGTRTLTLSAGSVSTTCTYS